MYKFFGRRMGKKGFTLIELIVVIAILGILAAIAIPRIAGFQDAAKVRSNEANRTLCEKAAAMDYASNGTYPSTAARITSMVTTYMGGTVPSVQAHGAITVDGVAVAATAATDDFYLNTTTGVVTIRAAAAVGEILITP